MSIAGQRAKVSVISVGFRVGVAQGAQGFLEKTTPNPEVASGALRSRTVIVPAFFIRIARQARRTGADAHLHASTREPLQLPGNRDRREEDQPAPGSS
jgi:hypothetical protein